MHTSSLSDERNYGIYRVIFIGAGFSGTLAALEYVKYEDAGNVLILDENEEPVGKLSSSYNQCYKLHIGHHYIGDLATAEQCLLDSIYFARNYPTAINGDLKDPWRRGVNFILRGSLYSESEVREICEKLKDIYKTKVELDIANKVFGEPEDFIKFISVEKFPAVSSHLSLKDGTQEENMSIVMVVETGESQFDINKLKSALKLSIQNNLKIQFSGNMRVQRISYDMDSLNYVVEALNLVTQEKVFYKAESVVNATWQNVEYIDRQLSLYNDQSKLTRIKASLLVELPSELFMMNTCIFSVGPYCSFTNLGNGQAVITYEPCTNLGAFRSGYKVLDEELRKIIKNRITTDSQFGKELSEQIISGCARFIPALSKASLIEIRVGFVKIILKEDEEYTLDRRESPIHRRQEDGIEVKELCYFSISGMKAVRALRNAEKLSEIMVRNIAIKRIISSVIEKMKDNLNRNLCIDGSYNKSLIINATLYYPIKNFLLTELGNLELNYLDVSHVDPECIESWANQIRLILERKCVLSKDIKSLFEYSSAPSFFSMPNSNMMNNIKYKVKQFEDLSSSHKNIK